jgi:DNA-binding CsgD family transcriptional regulator
MSQLRHDDYPRILRFVETLYSFDDEVAFSKWIVREISKLVPCHHASWNEMAFTVSRSTVVEYPRLDNLEHRTKVFSENMLDHPGLIHYLSTGDISPVAISDLVSSTDFERTALYQELYRGMGYEDQIGMCLSPPAGEVAALSLARETWGFDGRDREILHTLQPHMARAYRNVKTLSRARYRLQDDGLKNANVAMLEIGPHGEVIRGMSRATRLLSEYCRSDWRPSQVLPDTLQRWLRHQAHTPLTIHRGKRRLIARFFPVRPRNGMCGLLLIEDRTAPQAVSRLYASGLTAREFEVLLELEKGCSNEDIAAALSISPRTVKKHLENIYAKLGISSRTAALAWLHHFSRLDH